MYIPSMNKSVSSQSSVNALKKFVLGVFRQFKLVHYLVIAVIVALGIFNAVTGAMPYINQQRYERGIEKSFNKWWTEEGAERFKSVGLEPTEKIRNEEFEQFRSRALAQKPSYIVEDRIEVMKKDFREWWEIKGGRETFVEEHKRYPDESDFRHEQERWINSYTDKFLRYNMAFIPKRGQYDNLLTSWMLFPSVWSFLIFAVFFIFVTVQMERRWQWYILWGCVVGLALFGGIFVSILTGTSFFDHYDGERYMGMSLVLVFLLGATAFAPRKDMVSPIVSAACFVGLLLDMIVNWFVNPGIFGAVTILSPVLFGAGAFAGTKVETRRKSMRELKQDSLAERAKRVASRNPMEEMKAKTRALIDAGFSSAKLGQFDQAQRQLVQAMTQLLQEHPVDGALVKSLAERMTSPTLYIELMSNQWLEWGEIAKAKNSPEAAILLLKKGLSHEKDRNFARRALYVLGETCVTNKIEIEDGMKRLQKVIEMNGDDMMAKQAQRILDSIKST